MRIAIVTMGTHGEVQPYVALALGLRAAGCEVRFVTHAFYESLVRGHGLDLVPLTCDPVDVLRSDDLEGGYRVLEDPLAFARSLGKMFRLLVRETAEECIEGCRGVDGILFSFPALFVAHIAEAMRVPAVGGFVYPTLERLDTRANSLSPGDHDPALYAEFRAEFEDECWRELRPAINELRSARLKLLPLSSEGPWRYLLANRVPILYGISPRVFPSWARVEDWCRVTGYWFLDSHADWQPPEALLDFLDAGSPPVFVTFGSMPIPDTDRVRDAILGALESTRQRAIVQAGWGDLSIRETTSEVFPLSWAPYDWLVPRMAALVHHGGAGTTSQALRAGIPSVVVPVGWEQHIWGRQVHDLGAGPPPIPLDQLTADGLATAIRRMLDDASMHERVRDVSRSIRCEDGVATATNLLVHYWSGRGLSKL